MSCFDQLASAGGVRVRAGATHVRVCIASRRGSIAAAGTTGDSRSLVLQVVVVPQQANIAVRAANMCNGAWPTAEVSYVDITRCCYDVIISVTSRQPSAP